MRDLLTAILLVGGLAGCKTTSEGRAPSVSHQKTSSEVVDPSYQTQSFGWASGGTVLVFMKAMESGGVVKFCGSYGGVNLTMATSELTSQALDGATLHLGPVPITTGLRFFAKLPDKTNPLGQPSNCILTDLVWRPEFAELPVRAKLGRVQFTL